MTFSVVLADANVLFARLERDFLMYAGIEGVIEVHWSDRILDEMTRNQIEKVPGFTPARAQLLRDLMNKAITNASVEPGADTEAHGHVTKRVLLARVQEEPRQEFGLVPGAQDRHQRRRLDSHKPTIFSANVKIATFSHHGAAAPLER